MANGGPEGGGGLGGGAGESGAGGEGFGGGGGNGVGSAEAGEGNSFLLVDIDGKPLNGNLNKRRVEAMIEVNPPRVIVQKTLTETGPRRIGARAPQPRRSTILTSTAGLGDSDLAQPKLGP